MQPINHRIMPEGHNPLPAPCFLGEPDALEDGGRLYVYAAQDAPAEGRDGQLAEMNQDLIQCIRIISSADLNNWTDHGAVAIAGEDGVAPWAETAWGPAPVKRTVNGNCVYYLFFCSRAWRIGVLTAPTPTGPFTDPLGRALLTRDTPGCRDVPWLMDVSVLAQDGETPYLVLGGGLPDGCDNAHPRSARLIPLSDDLLSVAGPAQPLDAPYFFQSSHLCRMAGQYVYSYCINWKANQALLNGESVDGGQIAYMAADSPAGPYRYVGVTLHNPGEYFGCYGASHHALVSFNGKWYALYQTHVQERALGMSKGYRCLHMDALCLRPDGLPANTPLTKTGVPATASLCPYQTVSGATFACLSGMTWTQTPQGACPQSMLEQAIVRLNGADFGANGAQALEIQVQTNHEGTALCVFFDTLSDAPVGRVTLSRSTAPTTVMVPLRSVPGRHDVFLVFGLPGATFLHLRFIAADVPPQPRQLTEAVGKPLLLGADFPDPDVIRVGDTFYMVSTTMHFMPGAVLLKSPDLLHWEIVGHVLERLDDTPPQRLQGDEDIYGKGMWAATLRYWAGCFYVAFICHDTGKTYLYRARDIEGPWEKRAIEGFYYDSSLLFDDDGRVYIVHGNATIRVTELNEDLSGPKRGGFNRVILRDKDNRILGFEGSHFYKIDGRYYLFLIHSLPTVWRRVEACYVSDTLDGTFIGRDVLNDDMGYYGQGVAQGGVVQGLDGRYYAVLFQDRGAVGRVPVLLPVTWKDGFPIFGVQGRIPDTVSVACAGEIPLDAPICRCDDFTAETLHPVWAWNHTPVPCRTQTGDGRLLLRTGAVCARLTQATNTLTQRATLPGCEAIVDVDGSALQAGDMAGLCALQGRYAQIAMTRDESGYALVMLNRADPHQNLNGAEQARVPWPQQTVRFRMTLDFDDLRDTARFYYWQDGWKPLGDGHKLSFHLDHFTGCRVGLYAYATKRSGGEAAFSHFRITQAQPQA